MYVCTLGMILNTYMTEKTNYALSTFFFHPKVEFPVPQIYSTSKLYSVATMLSDIQNYNMNLNIYNYNICKIFAFVGNNKLSFE